MDNGEIMSASVREITAKEQFEGLMSLNQEQDFNRRMQSVKFLPKAKKEGKVSEKGLCVKIDDKNHTLLSVHYNGIKIPKGRWEELQKLGGPEIQLKKWKEFEKTLQPRRYEIDDAGLQVLNLLSGSRSLKFTDLEIYSSAVKDKKSIFGGKKSNKLSSEDLEAIEQEKSKGSFIVMDHDENGNQRARLYKNGVLQYKATNGEVREQAVFHNMDTSVTQETSLNVPPAPPPARKASMGQQEAGGPSNGIYEVLRGEEDGLPSRTGSVRSRSGTGANVIYTEVSSGSNGLGDSSHRSRADSTSSVYEDPEQFIPGALSSVLGPRPTRPSNATKPLPKVKVENPYKFDTPKGTLPPQPLYGNHGAPGGVDDTSAVKQSSVSVATQERLYGNADALLPDEPVYMNLQSLAAAIAPSLPRTKSDAEKYSPSLGQLGEKAVRINPPEVPHRLRKESNPNPRAIDLSKF